MVVGQVKVSRLTISSEDWPPRSNGPVLEQVAAEPHSMAAMPRVATRAFTLLRQARFQPLRSRRGDRDRSRGGGASGALGNSVAFATYTKLESVLACVKPFGHARTFLLSHGDGGSPSWSNAHDPRIAQICDGLWEHSLSVAILSHDLVEALPGLDAEAAYLAGCLHDIGRPVVAEMLLDAEGRLLGKRVDHWIMPDRCIIVQCERTVGSGHASLDVADSR